MPLHRLSMNQCDTDRLGTQNIDQTVHRAFADDHVIRFNGGTIDMHRSLGNHIYHLLGCSLRGKSAGMHMNIGHVAEHGIAFLEELLPAGIGVTIEHGTSAATIGAFHRLFRVSIEIHHATALGDIVRQCFLCGRRHGRSPTKRENAVKILKKISDEIGLNLAEGGLTMLIEIGGNFHTHLVLDFHIGIGEWQPQHVRHFLANTGFAGTHHADDYGVGTCCHSV